jgi:hypothetical protein
MSDSTNTVTISVNGADADSAPEQLTLDRAADCRGRNGWFAACEFTIWRLQAGQIVELNVWSRQRGDSPPIVLQMPPALAMTLADSLLAVVEKETKQQA